MIAALKLPITKKLRLNKSELNDIARQVVRHFQDDIIEMNQQRLFSGKYTSGEGISPDYTKFTVDTKKKRGQPTDRVTLKDTGDFYESIYVNAGSGSFYTGARDAKTEALQEKYEDADSILLGLSEQDKDRFRELTLKEFAQKYFERLL